MNNADEAIVPNSRHVKLQTANGKAVNVKIVNPKSDPRGSAQLVV